MKITFVVPGYARKAIGGIRVVYCYANTLVSLGHEVSVVHAACFRMRPSLRDGRPLAQARELVGGVRDLARGAPESPTWQWIDERVALDYVPTIANRHLPEADAIVATAWQTADPVAAADPSKGRGCYLIQHHETWSGSADRVDATWRLPLRRIFIAPWLYARADAMGLDDSWRIGGAIDTERFHVETPIEARPRRVVMLYSQHTWKGAREGVEALVRAHEAVPDLRAVLFGTGTRPDDLPSWIEYRCDPPQRDLVDDVYNGSSVYLCPSHAEGWHLPPAEAMASGCALVSTDIDGVSEYALDGYTALLSPVGDVGAQASNLVRLFADDDRRVELARAGHAHIQQFTWGASTRTLVDVLAAEPILNR